jgi:lysophospholipase L1-like esterase
MPHTLPFKPIFLAFFILLSGQVKAVRTAVFPEKIRVRAAVWVDQNRVFSTETSADQKRPIWIHAGDSIATSWGNADTLADALKKAESSELPQPGTVPDLFSHLPDPDQTWYAGEQLARGGLFQFLESRSNQEWVLISTALAGSMLSQNKMNPLKLPLEVKNLERVKLVTFSIGGNDICSDLNPFLKRETDPSRLLFELKNSLPKDTVFAALKIPPVSQMYQTISAQLEALPESPSKRKLQNYCKQMWEEISCPALKNGDEKVSSLRNKIISSFENAGVKMIDLDRGMATTNVLDLLSSDCFHPSRKTQRAIFDATAKVLDRELFRNP